MNPEKSITGSKRY